MDIPSKTNFTVPYHLRGDSVFYTGNAFLPYPSPEFHAHIWQPPPQPHGHTDDSVTIGDYHVPRHHQNPPHTTGRFTDSTSLRPVESPSRSLIIQRNLLQNDFIRIPCGQAGHYPTAPLATRHDVVGTDTADIGQRRFLNYHTLPDE